MEHNKVVAKYEIISIAKDVELKFMKMVQENMMGHEMAYHRCRIILIFIIVMSVIGQTGKGVKDNRL